MKKSEKILIVILCLIIAGLAGFIVWDKVINNNNNENTYAINDDETKMANEAIKEALEDKEWIDNNVVQAEYSMEPELTFIKIKSDSGNPMYIVRVFAMDVVNCSSMLITYENGTVQAKQISNMRQSDIMVDANYGIVKVIRANYGGCDYYGYLKIENNQIKQLDYVEEYEEGYYDDGNKYVIGDSDGYRYVTKEEFDSIQSKYDKYNYVSIDTVLTNENIEKIF